MLGEVLREGAVGHGLGEGEALDLVAAGLAQQVHLLEGIDPFGDHLQAQLVGERAGAAHQSTHVRVHLDVANQGAVELQHVERQVDEAAQGGEARAEVVEGEAHEATSHALHATSNTQHATRYTQDATRHTLHATRHTRSTSTSWPLPTHRPTPLPVAINRLKATMQGGQAPPEITQSMKERAVGQCNFMLLFIMSTAAIACTLASASYCNFMDRNIKLREGTDIDALCSVYTDFTNCDDLLKNHGVGFWGWQITVPIDTLVC